MVWPRVPPGWREGPRPRAAHRSLTSSRAASPTLHCPVYRRERRAGSTAGEEEGRRRVEGPVEEESRAARRGLAKRRRAEWAGREVAPEVRVRSVWRAACCWWRREAAKAGRWQCRLTLSILQGTGSETGHHCNPCSRSRYSSGMVEGLKHAQEKSINC